MPTDEYLIRYTLTGENPLNYEIPYDVEWNRSHIWNLRMKSISEGYDTFFSKVFKAVREIWSDSKLEAKLETLLKIEGMYTRRDQELIRLGFLIPVGKLCRVNWLFSLATITIYAHRKQKYIVRELKDYLHLKKVVKKGIENIDYIYEVKLEDLINGDTAITERLLGRRAKEVEKKEYIGIEMGNFVLLVEKGKDSLRINPFSGEIKMVKNESVVFTKNQYYLSRILGRNLEWDYLALEKLRKFFEYVKGRGKGRKTLMDFLNDPHAISLVDEYLRWQKIKEAAISKLKPSI